MALPARYRAALTRNVLALGLVSLLTDAASEMIVPLLPLFVTQVLGGGAMTLGWIEGVADSAASLLKLLSGRLADRMGRYMPLVITGYGLATIARPLVALATAPWHVLLVRLADRTGKGIRESPRDAVLAASVPPERAGTAFGFHKAMDYVGAVLGPAMGLAILALSGGSLRTVFACAAVPGVLVLVALTVGAREPPPVPHEARRVLSGWPTPVLSRFLLPLALFTLGNASDLFLLIKAGGTKDALTTLPLIWMAYNTVRALTSLASGDLVDRFGPRRVIGAGWLVYALVYVGFAFAESTTAMFVLFMIYGTYHGLCRGAEKALVASLAPRGQGGAAFGWYHLTVGLLTLPASVLFGVLWDRASPAAAFLVSAGLAAAGLALLAVMRPRAPSAE